MCTLRAMNCELNYLSVPDGSTMFMQGIKHFEVQFFDKLFFD